MSDNLDSETRPSYIKRVERINPEKQLTDVLTQKFGQKFSDYRKEYFKILDGNEYIHKVINYSNQFDNTLFLEGAGNHNGLFEIAFTPHLVTQKLSNYIHNGKDKINKKALCTF